MKGLTKHICICFLMVFTITKAQGQPCLDNFSECHIAPQYGLCKVPIFRKEYCPFSCGNCASKNNQQLQANSRCNAASLTESSKAAFQRDNQRFSIDLFKAARQLKPNENLIFSPASILMALGMVLEGAAGNTQQQIKSSMLPSVPQNQLDAVFNYVQNELNQDQAFHKLYTANRIYLQQDFTVKPEFLNSIQNCHQSMVIKRNFRAATERTRLEINKWVENTTNQKIKDLLAQGIVTADTIMVLVNAIYFKADWMHQFNGRNGGQTIDGAFYPHTSPNSPKTVKMMSLTRTFDFYEDQTTAVLRMPYKNDELSMFIMLPKQRTGLPALERSLTPSRLSILTSRVQPKRMKVYMPKFKIESDLELKKMLKTMGMTEMFTRRADLSNINSTAPLFVSDAVHKAFIQVNENGTEAAAATAMIVMSKSMFMSPQFRVDHPFLFTIVHESTNSILFMGSVYDILMIDEWIPSELSYKQGYIPSTFFLSKSMPGFRSKSDFSHTENLFNSRLTFKTVNKSESFHVHHK